MMKNQSDYKVILSQNQIKVLLRGSGYYYVRGMTLDNTKIDDYTLIDALNSLVRQGMLKNSGDSFVMTGDIRKIITMLGQSSSFAAVRTRNIYLPDLCCYIGDEILACDLMKRRNKDVSFLLTNADCFIDELRDEGYFPSDEEPELFDEAELAEYDKSVITELTIDNTLSEYSKIIFMTERTDCNPRQKQCLAVIEYYLYSYILYFEGSKVCREPYTFMRLKEVLKKRIFGSQEA